jgi:hypothetical protein
MRKSDCVTNSLLGCLVLVVGLGIVGCGTRFRVDYGKSRGAAGDQSINGFGGLRRAYDKAGWSTRDVNRLNDRLAATTAIVWTPTVRDTLFDNSTKWFDKWLGEQTRTLVYVVPDQGCEAHYISVARQLAPSDQRLEYRRRLARIETDQMVSRLRDDSIPSNGWFTIERTSAGTTVGNRSTEVPTGQWTLPSSTDPAVTTLAGTNIEYKIVPAATVTPPASPTNSASSPNPNPPVVVSPSYGPTYGASTVELTHTTLLSADDGSPIITRVTSEEWGQSKLIVVGDGSLLCNFSLATPQGQAIATQLIAETGEHPGLVGFLSTDYGGAPISDVNPEINSLTGMELFTVWPLSLIIVHLAVMGFVACMILLPIFGRPCQAEAASHSDFADHLDAVAVLMSRSGGEEYARHRVSEYMRRIRGETAGVWVLPESKPTKPLVEPPSSASALLSPSNLTTPPTKAAP